MKKYLALLCAGVMAFAFTACGNTLKPAYSAEMTYTAVWPVPNIATDPTSSVRDAQGNLAYYTVQQDGLWGLVRADGTEVLPCKVPQPVFYCQGAEWHWTAPLDWEEIEALNASLAQSGDGYIGGGHGGGGTGYVLAVDRPQQGAQRYDRFEVGGKFESITQPEFAQQSGWVPVVLFRMEEMEAVAATGDPAYFTPLGYNFADAQGTLLFPDTVFENVGEFGTHAIAPVKQNGKWAYVDGKGMYKTEFIYEGAWGTQQSGYDEAKGEVLYDYATEAYSLHTGFAPVSREGLWGVIDESGTEVVPCEYEGAAPADGGAWIQKDGVWRRYHLSIS